MQGATTSDQRLKQSLSVCGGRWGQRQAEVGRAEQEASQQSRTNNGLRAQSCGRQQGSTGEILCLLEPTDGDNRYPQLLRGL